MKRIKELSTEVSKYSDYELEFQSKFNCLLGRLSQAEILIRKEKKEYDRIIFKKNQTPVNNG